MASRTPRRRSAPLTQKDYAASPDPEALISSSDVAALPRPGASTLTSVKFHFRGGDDDDGGGGDDKRDGEWWVTYLSPVDGTSLVRRLLATNVSTKETREMFDPGDEGREEDYSLEEKLRRERSRTMSTGVTSYAWASDASEGGTRDNRRMIVPLGGAIWVLDDPLGDDQDSTNKPRKLVEMNAGPERRGAAAADDDFHALPPNAPLLDAKISSDGSTVAFVAGNEVYTMPSDGSGGPRRVTSGARGVDGLSNGVADYLAQEELDRPDGFWLSPRGSRVAYESVDERHIPGYRIVHQGEDKGLSSTFVAAAERGAEGPSSTTTDDVAKGAKVTYEEHRYPFAGARNPIVKLGVARTEGGADDGGGDEVTWFDLEKVFGDDFYLAKVAWLPPPAAPTAGDDDEVGSGPKGDSTKLVAQLLDRRQKELALVLLDCADGSMTTLHVERAMEGGWINLNDAFRPLPASAAGSGEDDDDCRDAPSTFRFLWASERDGYRHLYVLEDGGAANARDGGAKAVRRLTGPGEFVVEQVLDVDEGNGCVYYMGTSPGRWLDRHLFRVPIWGGDAASTLPECLTDSLPGQHSCVVNSKAGAYVDIVSSVSRASLVAVRKLPPPPGRLCEGLAEEALPFELHDAAAVDPRVSSLRSALRPPTFHTFPSKDGKVTLQGALYVPDEKTHGKGPYPLVVATYGGPHVQYVQNGWTAMTADARSQFLTANGFAVLKVDNRGSSRRGLVFETPIRGNLGELEVADQVAGVEWAVERGVADGERVAVSGWSYGGYLSLKCLTDRPDVFHAAVSGAPVTDWALYDTAYTERYMGLPQENPKGYAKSSALAKVGDVRGSLLLCHGLLDENVLFRQNAVLVNALIEYRKAYELALFPSERHGPRRVQDRAFLEERILAFLQRSLGLKCDD